MTLPTAEAVARVYCRQQGFDPDSKDNPEGWPNWRYYRGRAENALERRREQAEWDAAIEEARG